MAIATEITQRRKAEQAIQKEQQLLRRLLDLHERDRQLTAYEIHDGFSQYLTGALYNLQGFRELQARKPRQAWEIFDAGLLLIQRSIEEARRLIGGLRPPILDESGIVAAIDYLACEAAESKEAEVEFIHDVKFQRLASPLESVIFRIVQESLTNARRHSQCAKIRIELRQHDDRIRIDVRDWGLGFDPTKVEEGRFGLQGIRERARLFGGQVSIETAPQQGTHVSVELPLVERAGEAAAP
jgi:signal transduction histidine kinase